jgi:2-phosphosulfolactate phosphatase
LPYRESPGEKGAGLRREHVQDGYDVRLEWGREGVVMLGTRCVVVVIIDVLSFCMAVDVAPQLPGGVLTA